MNKTIVYLHGLNCTSTIFNYMSEHLPSHNAIKIDYPSQGRVEDSYDFIMQFIPKGTPITIISHSLGGILAHLISTRDNGVIVDNLITMSSPFGGSSLASFVKWFYPNYKILKDITPSSCITLEVLHTKPTSRFLSLVSTAGGTPYINGVNDGVVSISSQTAIPADERLFFKVNHFEIVQDDSVIQTISDFIFR